MNRILSLENEYARMLFTFLLVLDLKQNGLSVIAIAELRYQVTIKSGNEEMQMVSGT